MVTYRYGGRAGRQYALKLADDYIVVRTRSRRSLDSSLESKKGREVLADLEQVARFHHAGVEVFRYGGACRTADARGVARKALTQQRDVQFAGRVLVDPRSRRPVLYTENVFVKFDADMAESVCRQVLKAHRLTIKRPIEYVRNAFFAQTAEGTGRTVFEITDRLLRHPQVDLCHPELVRKMGWRQVFQQQWHLRKTTIGGKEYNAHANVEAAWALSQGEGIRIAVIDDGCDLEHEEWVGSGKIVAPRDVTRRTDDPRPGSRDNHGTACSGVACANGQHGASGVAPKAQLMPIRYASPLGSQAEADAFVWAALHGADVISCSWGPEDGDWWDPSDPTHQQVVPLPDSTRTAIDWAISNGRNGKGCVITFAAGNGNESVDNDGYASYEKVIAVAACHAGNKRSAYSDFGKAVWCTFPSNDTVLSLPGIWTTDRSGTAGYNPGQVSRGDAVGNYVNDFGGTSSACPGVAGVAALVLSRNPSLRWDEVRDLLKRSCDRIDSPGGTYQANGHSPFYGYGRVNAMRAVELAAPTVTTSTVTYTASRVVPIRDLKTSTISVTIGETDPISAVAVRVDIEHSYVGDLVVKLIPPSSTRVKPIVLHERQGGGAENLRTTYDAVNTSLLTALVGKTPRGRWRLAVQDKERQDIGRILQFSVELRF